MEMEDTAMAKNNVLYIGYLSIFNILWKAVSVVFPFIFSLKSIKQDNGKSV
jgi:hypothetical protein